MDINKQKIVRNIIKEYKDQEIVYKGLSYKDFESLELLYIDELVQKLIEEHNLKNIRKRIIIDLKIRNYEKDEYTCYVKDWHHDGSLNNVPRENIYYIFCIGAPTEFIDCQEKVHNINQAEWYKYGENELHRGPQILKNCHRIWIRVTLSDYIKTQRI